MSTPTQHWDPRQYQENAGFVPELGRAVVDLLDPKAGESILDLGCGDGTLTIELARSGAEVVGVDASQEMVEAARLRGVQAYVMHGAELPFSDEFDAVFSNAALHWIRPPEAVVDGVWRALRPGGRFVGEFGGFGNVAAIIQALEVALAGRGLSAECPWYFPTPQTYAAMLEGAGFRVLAMEHFPRPTPLKGDARGWLETFAHSYLQSLSTSGRDEVLSEVVERLRSHLVDAEGNWHADYVRLRFRAERPRDAI
jgi:SAM-dependent methyltransferase